MENVEQTILSQYANSPVIVQLVKNMNDYIDQSTDFQNWYDFVWNVGTAQGFGLDIWGRIVGIDRVVELQDLTGFFGFETQTRTNDYLPFDQGVWFSGSNPLPYSQSDQLYRKMILVKALANISQCTAPAVNQLLQNIFVDRGKCYCNDLGAMTCKLTFEFTLEPVEKKYLDNGIIPHPAGVLMTYEEVGENIGFKEMGAHAYPFGEGTWRP